MLDAGDDKAARSDRLHALAIGIYQVRARLVERLQIVVVKAGPLAKLSIPSLQSLRSLAIRNDVVDPGADFLHLLEIGILVCSEHLCRAHLIARQLHNARPDAAR